MKSAALLILIALGLAGCAVAPPSSSPVASVDSPLAQVALAHRAQAELATRESRWADAVDLWEVVVLAQPDSDASARLEESRRRGADAARSALRNAAEARRRGDGDAAATEYLRALVAERGNAAAIAGLREIERDRMARAYFNRAPRGSITPMGAAPGAQGDLDVGTMLYRQGDSAGAVPHLQRHLERYPKNEPARAQLADAAFQAGSVANQADRKEEALRWFELAQRAGYPDGVALGRSLRELRREVADGYCRAGAAAEAQDRTRALFLWERCLKVDPLRADAAARIQALRQAGRKPPA